MNEMTKKKHVSEVLALTADVYPWTQASIWLLRVFSRRFLKYYRTNVWRQKHLYYYPNFIHTENYLDLIFLCFAVVVVFSTKYRE